jgi:hypothetical protein
MPATVTVWTVELEHGVELEEQRGLLGLSSDALVFSPRDEDQSERRYPFGEIIRARRLRGSPVLMILRQTEAGPHRTAFYFVQPPPLPNSTEVAATTSALGRNPRRKTRRQNVSYLGLWNREKKALLREWERQVQAAVRAARGSA